MLKYITAVSLEIFAIAHILLIQSLFHFLCLQRISLIIWYDDAKSWFKTFRDPKFYKENASNTQSNHDQY